MEAINRERAAHQHNALRPLGVNADQSRFMSAQVGAMGLEAEILALPIWTGGQAVMQNPSTGALQFVWGLSAWGSSDEL